MHMLCMLYRLSNRFMHACVIFTAACLRFHIVLDKLSIQSVNYLSSLKFVWIATYISLSCRVISCGCKLHVW